MDHEDKQSRLEKAKVSEAGIQEMLIASQRRDDDDEERHKKKKKHKEHR